MRKKIFSLLTCIFSLFIGIISVSAANNPYTVSAHDIPSDTYIIGTHVFDENRSYLSTQDIMWASRSIDGESKEDMIIYYKDMNGLWVNGLTGENITVPSTFKIEEYNGENAEVVLINMVLVEEEIEGGGTMSSSIHPDDYDELSIYIPREEGIDSADYTVEFNAHNFNDGEYKFQLEAYDTSDTEQKIDLGSMPATVNISNGLFRLPISIDLNTVESAICYFSLTNEEFSYEGFFVLYTGEATPELNGVFAVADVSLILEEGYGTHPLHLIDTSHFQDIDDASTNVLGYEFGFAQRFLEEGDYNADVKVYNSETDEEITELFEVPTTINVKNFAHVFEMADASIYVTPNEDLQIGDYYIDVTVYDSDENELTFERVYLTVTNEARIEVIEMWEYPEEYYDLDNFSFDSSVKREFTTPVLAENIPVGIYAIKTEFEYDGMAVLPNHELQSFQNVEVVKPYETAYFNYDFVVPKGEGIGKYNVTLTLYELTEDEDGYIVLSDTIIARTSFAFSVVPNAPKLEYTQMAGDDGYGIYDFKINHETYVDSMTITGWELAITSENNEGEDIIIDEVGYTLHTASSPDEIVSGLQLDANDTYKVRARAFTKVIDIYDMERTYYSDWSEEVEIIHTDGE